MAISGASSLVGCLAGLIFGVPKAHEAPENNHDANGSVKQYQPNKYQPNDNFELISDWLTKIIVGVGLIEIKELPDAIYDLSLALKPVLGNQMSSGVFGVSMVIYFFMGGFMICYLYARLRLGKALDEADKGDMIFDL